MVSQDNVPIEFKEISLPGAAKLMSKDAPWPWAESGKHLLASTMMMKYLLAMKILVFPFYHLQRPYVFLQKVGSNSSFLVY